ncbi:HAMP domain-containing sensor histidine kinase [Pseudonocardia sp. WMMC193]|uniref:sensor histidine kinase n=1 Tax=Pseudonocardia sp. WMMC193 TaxID=2911965 RepID=UPI001F2759E2|nr:HAMP domain-containing sensor histidine kinase [Pseudonocardia sp. WMMC193]MCF7552484.1 HAMP domain-containing histidine kinase [Pseudonocardia sp. WMMC193]
MARAPGSGVRDRLRARLGVRTTTALAAAVTVAVVLVVAGAALVLGLNALLRMQIMAAADQQATQLGERVAANFAGSDDIKRNAILATGKRSDYVEVVTDYNADPNHEPDVQNIGSSDPLPEYPLMSDLLLQPGETDTVDTWVTLNEGKDVEVLVLAKGFEFPPTGQHFTVLAAQPVDFLHRAVDTVMAMVLVGIPVLVVLVGGFTYLFAGRALRPVEAIRARVAGLTDRDLGQRVPVPAARDEVGMLAETMNQMLGRLEGSQVIQRRFVADASHELRSPLTTIASGLELLDGTVDEADRSTVHTLRGEAARLDRLVDGLLLLARSDERGLQPHREDVDLDEIVEAERGRPSDVGGVDPEVRADPVRVSGDRAQLVRAVRNLVDNARRHARSRVVVTLVADGASAVVDVADDGAGVPPADRGRVFERFVRLDDARARADGGAGLGLAIVKEIVTAHDGTVEVLDSPLGGALFRIRLPLVDAGVPDPDPEPAPVLYDDRPPVPRPAPEPGYGAWTGEEQPTRPTPTGGGPDQPTRPVPRPTRRPRPHPADAGPTRPTPIRLGDATSPADVNPTGPLPVVPPLQR